jgi:uncharacterized protein with PQ loop repeat
MDPMILGWIATTIFSMAIVFQINKTIRTKTTDGVSAMLFVANLVGNVVALVYATMIGQPPLQIKYIIGLIVSAIGITVYLIYHLRSKPCHTYRRNE